MTRLRGLCTGMLAGGIVLLAGACNENRETGAVSSRTAEGTSSAPASDLADDKNVALVRLINAIPAGGPVTVLAGDSAAFSGVPYKSATPFRELPDDRLHFKLGSAEKPLAENRENLAGGDHYTVIVMPDAGGADKRNMRVLEDDLEPVAPERARIRVVNAVPGDLEIDVYVRGREEPVFNAINFKSEAGWEEIDPMAGTLEIRPDGKNNVLASVPNVKFEGGRSYTFVVAGTPAKPEVIKVEDDVAKDAT